MPGKWNCQVKPEYFSRCEILLNQTRQKFQVKTQFVTCRSCCVQQDIFRFEPGKMFRLTDPVKNARFDPNLGPNLNFFQVQINSPSISKDSKGNPSKIFKFLNQCFARLRCLKKCLKFTKPTCWINSCFAGETFLKPKSCKTLI